MPFTLRQLEIFVEAAKDENFRKTADRLGIAQPSISKHIKALERQAGGALFERQRGSAARLSSLGGELLDRARSMLKLAGKLGDAADNSQHGLPPLRMAAGHYLLDHWLRPSLRQFVGQHELPEIEFLRANDREAVLTLLRKGEADCGFYHGEPADQAEFVTRILRRSTVGLYASPGLAALHPAVPEDLVSCPFVLAPSGSDAETYQLWQLQSLGIRPKRIAARSQYTDYQLELVRAGRGMGLLFDDDAHALVATGELVRLPLAFAEGARCLVTNKVVPPHPSLESTIERICRSLAKQLIDRG